MHKAFNQLSTVWCPLVFHHVTCQFYFICLINYYCEVNNNCELNLALSYVTEHLYFKKYSLSMEILSELYNLNGFLINHFLSHQLPSGICSAIVI